MSHDDLRAKAKAHEATMGPWEAEDDGDLWGRGGSVFIGHIEHAADAAFIAAANPQVVLGLLDEIERLREILWQVEWEGGATCSVETPQPMCPWCGNTKEQGHSTIDDEDVRRDCALAGNLRRQPASPNREDPGT